MSWSERRDRIELSAAANYTPLAFENYTVLRVPYMRLAVNACAFEHLLPSPLCPSPNIFLDVLVTYLSFFPSPEKPYRLQVLEASQYSFHDNSSGMLAFDDSVMGMINEGRAELSTPDVSLRDDRVKRNPHYTHYIYTPQYILVSKQFGFGPPGLGIAELMMAPIGLWTILATTILARYLHSRLTRKLVPLLSRSVEIHDWALRLYFRSRLVLSIILGIALAAVASYLFMVFTRNRPRVEVVSSMTDLAEGCLSGRFRAIALSQTYMDAILVPKDTEDKRDKILFRQAAVRNPPLLIRNLTEAVRLIQGDKQGDWPVHVLVSDTDLEGPLRGFCGLESVVDTRYFSTNVIFYRHGINIPLDNIQAGLLRTKLQVLTSRYYAYADCGVGIGNFTQGNPITLGQMAGVFQCGGGAFTGALLLILAEIMSSFVVRRCRARPVSFHLRGQLHTVATQT